MSIIVLNEKTWAEFFQVALPEGLSERKRKAAEHTLTSSGFEIEYKFDQNVVDRRSLSLAKAQAASIARRIKTKTGLDMAVCHGIHVTG